MIRKRKLLFGILLMFAAVLAYTLPTVYGKGHGHGENKGKKRGWGHKKGLTGEELVEKAYGQAAGILESIGPHNRIFTPPEGTGSISYTLNRPALVRVRIKRVGDPHLLLRTLVSWEEREAGSHTEEWDGIDASGNVLNSDDYSIAVDIQPLSLDLLPEEENTILNEPDHLYGHFHCLHHPDKCGKFRLEVDSPQKRQKLNGIVPIETRLKGNFRGNSRRWGYGVRYYVDRELVHEAFVNPSDITEPQSFQYNIDTTAFENGKHRITVNMCDHNDHEAAATTIVDFQN